MARDAGKNSRTFLTRQEARRGVGRRKTGCSASSAGFRRMTISHAVSVAALAAILIGFWALFFVRKDPDGRWIVKVGPLVGHHYVRMTTFIWMALGFAVLFIILRSC